MTKSRKGYLIALLLYVSASAFARDDCLSNAKEGVSILDSGKLLHLPVNIRDRKLTFVFDTGANVTVIDSRFKSDLLGASVEVPIQTGAAFSENVTFFAEGPKIVVGGLEMQPGGIVMTDIQRLSQISGEASDGILGRDVFSNMVVELCPHRNIIVFSTNRIEPSVKGTIRLDFMPDRGDFTFVGKGPRGIPISFAIDSGSDVSVSLNPTDWKRIFGDGPEKTYFSIMGSFSGRTTTNLLARLPLLRIGAATYTNLLCDRMDNDRTPSFVGLSFLRRHDVRIDYLKHLLIMRQLDDQSGQDEWNMSGLSVEWRNRDKLFVSAVVERSPAYEVGILENDEILAINEQPTANLAKKAVRDFFRAGNATKVTLDIFRGGSRKKVVVILRREI